MISIIIPARNEPYLQNTIDDLFAKAIGDIEVIAILDNYWPDPPLKNQKDLIIVHQSKVNGMRSNINAGARIAKGKFLMKCDAHCCFDRGFDEKLKTNCKYNWTVVPRRYGLDVENWDRTDKIYDFQYIEKVTLKGKDWPEYGERVKGKEITALMTSQGSCWFMHRDRFRDLGGLDEVNYGIMGREAQEVCLKAWLSGGQYILNRKTWYAHWRKNKRTFPHDSDQRQKSKTYAMDTWKNNKWPMQKRSLEWLVEKFAPVPTWEDGKNKKVGGSRADIPVCQNDRRADIPVCQQARKPVLLLREQYKVDLKKPLPIIVKGFKRKQLAKFFRDLNYKKGAEIGVATGKYSEVLCKYNPGLELISVDPWTSYSEDPRRIRKHEENFREAQKRLAPYNATLMRMMSMDAVREIPKESLDFVYIDANHLFDFFIMDLIEWSKRIRPGGIVSGHDYYKFRNAGVIEGVDVYTQVHKIKPWFICDEKPASFFWMKS